MLTRTLATCVATIAATGTAQAGSVTVANLHDDFTEVLDGPGTPPQSFNNNGWSFFLGNTGQQLQFDSSLNGSGVAGYGDSPGDGGLELPHISEDGVFDGFSALEGELGFHPGDPNAGGDLVIRWTADQDYSIIDLNFDLRRAGNPGAAGADVGLFVALNGVRQITDILTDGPDNPLPPISGQLSFSDIEAGNFIDVIIFSAGSLSGDQSFGNVTVSTVPSPSAMLMGMAGFGFLAARRRRRSA